MYDTTLVRKHMCTRYFIEKNTLELTEIAESATHSSLTPKFASSRGHYIMTDGEIRPTDIVPVIAPNSKGMRTVFPMQWGFLDKLGKRTLFNARVETAATKPTFKDAWTSHRCIVPASYYFEWQHFKSNDGKEKTGDKYLIQPADYSVTWLCGLYRIEEGFPVFVILTMEPTEELSKIHDRMPLILPEEKIDEWITPSSKPEEIIPYALSDMIMEKVGA